MALDSGDPAGIVVLNSGDPVLIQRLSSCDSVSDQHRAIRQKQLSSAGSYDNLEAEDLCDLGTYRVEGNVPSSFATSIFF